MDKQILEKIKEGAEKLGTSYYKYVQPYIVNINQRIGKGSFGEVYKGVNILTSQMVAVKQISAQVLKKDSEKLVASLKNEIDIMKKTKHQNIVTLYDVRKSANNIYLFLELCNKGSLEDKLKKEGKLSQKESIELLRQITNGYKLLHEKNIVHRDLKPANILIKDDFYKIADFGFAKMFQDNQEEDQIHETLVGSPIYMCPQILDSKNYSTKCDVWSVGIIIFEVLFGRPPYIVKNLNELISAVKTRKVIFPYKLSNKKLEDLIRHMLAYEQTDRISWKELFDCELLNPKKEDLSMTLGRSMQAGEKLKKSTLGKSHIVNQVYFQELKVIKKVQLNVQEEKQVQQIANEVIKEEKLNFEEKHQDDMYKTVEKKHNTEERIKQTIRKITSYFLNRRNKAVFINHLSLKIYDCFEEGNLTIPIEQAQLILFVLSKYQCNIIYRNYLRVNDGKLHNCKKFTEEEFQLFLESPLKAKVLQNFMNDFKVMKLFLDELIVKVKQYITNIRKNTEQQVPAKIERISKICNTNLCNKDVMKVVLKENLEELLKSIREHANLESRSVLQLLYFAHHAYKAATKKEQKKDGKPELDYNKYYQQVQRMTDQELKGLLKA